MITAPRCPYCEGNPPARLADNKEIYGPRVQRPGNVWLCVNYPDKCDAYIGVIDGPLPRPAGTMANTTLRLMRQRVYKAVAPLFAQKGGKKKVFRELGEKMAFKGNLNIAALNDHQCLKVLSLLLPEDEYDRLSAAAGQ